MTCFAQILLHAAPALVLLSLASCEVTSIHLDDANRITGGKDTQQTTTDAKADLCSGHIQSVLSRRPRNIIYRNITSESRGRACLRRHHGPYAEGDKTPPSYGKKRSVRGIGDFSELLPPSTFGEMEEQNAAAAVEPPESVLSPRPPKRVATWEAQRTADSFTSWQFVSRTTL